MATKILAICLMLLVTVTSLKVYHESQYAYYTFDEGENGNKCKNHEECDGQRKCSAAGWCKGVSRPPKNALYYYNEATTKSKCPTSSNDKNWPNRDYYCDGNRSCSGNAWCKGVSR